MTQLTRKFPIALRLILRGSLGPMTQRSLQRMRRKTYSVFEVRLSAPRREINLCCYSETGTPGPFDPQSSALTDRPPATKAKVLRRLRRCKFDRSCWSTTTLDCVHKSKPTALEPSAHTCQLRQVGLGLALSNLWLPGRGDRVPGSSELLLV